MYVFITALSTSAHASIRQHMNTKKQLYTNKNIQNVTTCKQLYTEYHEVETLRVFTVFIILDETM